MTPSFRKALQAVLHLAIALPLALLAWRWSGVLLNDADPRLAGLSVEPVDYTIDYLGLWALRLLWLTLAISPLRQITGWNWLGAWRRPLGLWTFTYALLHLSVYFGLDQAGDLGLLVEDVIKHNFILLGMSALLLILPLHRLIYLAAALASVHFILRVKGFQWEPWIYAGLLALLLAWRFKPVRALIGR
jgi:methionine sulfoxide reductase heme-binding subunit